MVEMKRGPHLSKCGWAWEDYSPAVGYEFICDNPSFHPKDTVTCDECQLGTWAKDSEIKQCKMCGYWAHILGEHDVCDFCIEE